MLKRGFYWSILMKLRCNSNCIASSSYNRFGFDACLRVDSNDASLSELSTRSQQVYKHTHAIETKPSQRLQSSKHLNVGLLTILKPISQTLCRSHTRFDSDGLVNWLIDSLKRISSQKWFIQQARHAGSMPMKQRKERGAGRDIRVVLITCSFREQKQRERKTCQKNWNCNITWTVSWVATQGRQFCISVQ